MFGQDVFAQFAHGLRSTFLVGLLGGGLAAVVGMAIGFTAGYRGGAVDEALNMVTNVVLVIPTLAVLLIIATYLRVRASSPRPSSSACSPGPGWPGRSGPRRSRSALATSSTWPASARRRARIVLREIAPNMSSYLFMTFILLFGAVLTAAMLDFIGLGPTDGMSLGLMMNNAVLWSALPLGMWWWFIPPGLGITMIVGALYIMNVGLDEVFNPKLQEL